MRFSVWTEHWRTAALAGWVCIVAALAACGGGGGGGSESGGGGGTPGPTGLVPVAPAPGAVVVADSREFRPFSEGSVWTYRQYAPFTGPIETRVRQQSSGGSGVMEVDPNGVDAVVTLNRNASGDTVASLRLQLLGSRTLTITGTELTRELRAGQQLVLFDSRVADVGDLDGDGRTDALDVAVWRVVVGLEDQLLPLSVRPLSSLRVDERIVLRTVPSGGGASRRVESRGSSWYAEGLGLVRSLSLADDGVSAEDDRRLSSFDAGSRGVGLLALTEGAAPPEWPTGQTVVIGDQILALEPSFGLVLRDSRGRVVSTAPPAREGDGLGRDPQILATSSGVRLVGVPSLGNLGRVSVDAIGADGRLSGARLGGFDLPSSDVRSCPGCRRIAAHPESSTIWYATIESEEPTPGTSRDRLAVHRLGADGVLRGEQILFRSPSASYSYVDLRDAVAHASGLWVLLEEFDAELGRALRIVAFDNEGQLVFSRRYPPTVVDRVRLLVDGSAKWLAWRPIGDGTPGGEPRPRAVRLTDSGSPIGVEDTDEGLNAARLDALPSAFDAGWPFNVTVGGGRWWITGVENSSALDDGANVPSRHAVIGWLDPVDEAGLRAPPAVLRNPAGFVAPVGVVLRDRVLWGFGPLLLWR